MKFVVYSLFMGLAFSQCIGQEYSIRPLSIGDTVSDIVLNHLINYKTPTARLLDFRGKLVILDFWSTGCSSCIAAMPKMEALQKQFDGRLQIVLVNSWESEASIKSRIVNMKRYKPGIGLSTLPTAYGETIWRIVFPHTSVPHHAWIDGKGKVIAITNGYNATAEHIIKALKGDSLHLAVKKDLKASGYNPWKVGLFSVAHPSLHALFHSGFLPYNPGFGGGSSWYIDPSNGTYNRIWLNDNILGLYESAFSLPNGTRRTLIEVTDETPFMTPEDKNQLDEWQTKNLYSYQIALPLKEKENLQEYMQQDLNRFFGMERGIIGEIENREIPTLVLTLVKKEQLRTLGEKRNYQNMGDSVFQYLNTPFPFISSSLQYALEDMSKPIAFVDETGFTGNVDLQLSGNLHDLQNIRNQLKKYGLEVKEGMRKLEVLVIKAKKLIGNN